MLPNPGVAVLQMLNCYSYSCRKNFMNDLSLNHLFVGLEKSIEGIFGIGITRRLGLLAKIKVCLRTLARTRACARERVRIRTKRGYSITCAWVHKCACDLIYVRTKNVCMMTSRVHDCNRVYVDAFLSASKTIRR